MPAVIFYKVIVNMTEPLWQSLQECEKGAPAVILKGADEKMNLPTLPVRGEISTNFTEITSVRENTLDEQKWEGIAERVEESSGISLISKTA